MLDEVRDMQRQESRLIRERNLHGAELGGGFSHQAAGGHGCR